MKKYCVLIIILFYRVCSGQNLVPNPSFESSFGCPDGQGQISRVNNWVVVPGVNPSTPDFFKYCGSNGMTVPNNICGSQSAYDGNGYIGMFFYDNVNHAHEYSETQLTSPLVANQTYQVSMYVSVGENWAYAINNLGILLTVDQAVGNGASTLNGLYTPQINETNVVTNTSGWTLITGTYTAIGGESYLTIGNFHLESETNAVNVNPAGIFASYNRSYYYIDMVSVTTTLGVPEHNREIIKLYPNPVSDMLNFNSPDGMEIKSVKLFSTYGVLATEYNEQITAVNVSNLASGIYFAEITFGDESKITKRFSKL